MSVVKIRSRKVEQGIDFATDGKLIEDLSVFEKQMGWSIFDFLKPLEEKKADSLSITKEKPYHYFYARLSGKTIIMRLRTSDGETEFRLPLTSLKNK